MSEGFIAILVALVGACSGAIGVLMKWVCDRLDHKPTAYQQTLTRRLDHLDEENRKRDAHGLIVDDALKALLFDKIARLHAQTVENGKPVPTPVKTRVDAAYDAYAALGGNGVGKHYRDEMIEAHAKEDPE
ncbi:hypothetical protein [Bifidobacterium parmae]|uniref:Phage minor structural protein n=1 Tax=Bifidobacterium parmae TaxID=361854 RepID=A0A2N5IZZ3_9BIFI|nr:hypothetical protein [Bifidobacterium parmae]PLS27523.1 hypothetical protein Uis4E_1555 [Bifidobacterium parmae]